MTATRTVVVIASAALLLALGGCKGCADGGGAAVDAGDDDGGVHRPERTPPELADRAWADGGADPACTGVSIDLAFALGEARCAITSSTAKAIRAAFEADVGAADALQQKAKPGPDDRLELHLVNRGARPVTVPLSWHPKLAAFIVLASDPREKAVYELEAPRLEVMRGDGQDAGGARFARVVLPPGSAAVARITIDPRIVKRVDRPAADGAAHPAIPARLAPGKWTLHVGQLVTDVATGEPAMIAWDVR